MIRKIFTPTSNKVMISIPQEYVNHPLEVILFQLKDDKTEEFQYWTEEELNKFSSIVLSKDIDDKEDYSGW